MAKGVRKMEGWEEEGGNESPTKRKRIEDRKRERIGRRKDGRKGKRFARPMSNCFLCSHTFKSRQDSKAQATELQTYWHKTEFNANAD